MLCDHLVNCPLVFHQNRVVYDPQYKPKKNDQTFIIIKNKPKKKNGFNKNNNDVINIHFLFFFFFDNPNKYQYLPAQIKSKTKKFLIHLVSQSYLFIFF